MTDIRPRLLDLFCGAGGAAMGYYRAGFDVVGVDIKPQPHYPFEFHQADALEFLWKHSHDYDAIHASPPCQAYSNLTPKNHKSRHPMLIGTISELFHRLYPCDIRAQHLIRPWVIENVVGARDFMVHPTMFCGSMFGLKCYRHRLFETGNWELDWWPRLVCNHNFIPLLVTTASRNSRALRKNRGMACKSVKNAPAAYGIDWMTAGELAEAIPPAYTEFIGKQLLEQIR